MCLPISGTATENFLELMIRSKSSDKSISIVVALAIFVPSEIIMYHFGSEIKRETLHGSHRRQ